MNRLLNLDATLRVDSFWCDRAHFLEPVRTYDAGAPCYILPLVLSSVDSFDRFGFYAGEWWALKAPVNDDTDRAYVDPRWCARDHYIEVTRRFTGAGRVPALKLLICDKDDPRRFCAYRGSTWRLEGDQ